MPSERKCSCLYCYSIKSVTIYDRQEYDRAICSNCNARYIVQCTVFPTSRYLKFILIAPIKYCVKKIFRKTP